MGEGEPLPDATCPIVMSNFAKIKWGAYPTPPPPPVPTPKLSKISRVVVNFVLVSSLLTYEVSELNNKSEL